MSFRLFFLLSMIFTWISTAYASARVNYLPETPKDKIYQRNVEAGYKQITHFFGDKLEPINFKVFQSRASIDQYWSKKSNNRNFKSPCWMIATSEKAEVAILSPRVWNTDACEHLANEITIQKLAAHGHYFLADHLPKEFGSSIFQLHAFVLCLKQVQQFRLAVFGLVHHYCLTA